MFKKAKEYANEHGIEVIATGEVIGQRPMSQISSAMKTIDEEIGFEILRPLCAKRLRETSFEKKGIVDRSKLLNISGRGRKKQMELAEKFDIKYPSPGGGCFLCEKQPALRLKKLLENNLITEKTLPLTMIGRHFAFENNSGKTVWLVVARNEKESKIIIGFKNHIKDNHGKPAIYYTIKSENDSEQHLDEATYKKVLELQDAYSTGDNEDKRRKFSKFKL